MPQLQLQHTHAIVTGAASGIGFALAEAVLEAGGRVLLSDVDAGRLGAAMERLAAHGPRAHAVVADVAELGSVQAMVDAALTAWGRIDLLFNNAGIGGSLPIADATLSHWQRIIDINLWGVIHGVHAALPHMLA